MVPMVLLALFSFTETPPEVARFLDSFVDSFNNSSTRRVSEGEGGSRRGRVPEGAARRSSVPR